jgi:NNP family nitrate/nitrite transporter-like MFS transporter
VAGIIGAGGNVGAVAAGFLMKGLGDIQQTLSILGVLVPSRPCAHGHPFHRVGQERRCRPGRQQAA